MISNEESRQVMVDPRWRVQLEGEEEDIVLLERMLMESVKSARDFFIGRMDLKTLKRLSVVPAGSEEQPSDDLEIKNVPVFTTTRWDQFKTFEEVLAAATSQLNVLTGCLTMLTGSGPITIGTVYEFKPGGEYHRTRSTTLSFRVREAEKYHPTPQEFKAIVEMADGEEALRNLLFLQAQDVDWFVLYKMIEAIEDHLGGEKAVTQCTFINGAELKRAKQMANSVRHLDNSKHQPPKVSIKLDEARSVVRRAVKDLIASMRTSS